MCKIKLQKVDIGSAEKFAIFNEKLNKSCPKRGVVSQLVLAMMPIAFECNRTCEWAKVQSRVQVQLNVRMGESAIDCTVYIVKILCNWKSNVLSN